MEWSSFLDEFAQQIVNLAAKKDEDFVLIDGVLKKGYWRTINHNHVFIVDGKIEAGPPAFIGQDPKNIDWDAISEQAKEDEKEHGPLYGTEPREAVTKKYQTEVLKLRTK